MQHVDWHQLLATAQEEVSATLAALPTDLRDAAASLPVTYLGRPDRALRRSGIEADTLGLFVGGAHPDGEAGGVHLPAQILLFLENVWEMAEGDEQIYREEIRTTLMHELGHYLGLDEDDLDERGLA